MHSLSSSYETYDGSFPNFELLTGDRVFIMSAKVLKEKRETLFEDEKLRTDTLSGDMALKEVKLQTRGEHKEEKPKPVKMTLRVANVLVCATGIRKLSNVNDDNVGGALNPPDSSFFREKSPIEYSDVSDGSGSDTNTKPQQEMQFMSDEVCDHSSRLIIVYVDDEGDNNLVEKAQFRMYECKGLYSFAREVQSVCEEENTSALAHVSWPWSTHYLRAEYYARRNRGRPILLDPLRLSWESFSGRLDYVVMKDKTRTVDVEAALVISLQIFKDERMQFNATITRSLLQGRPHIIFYRVLFLYTNAYQSTEPSDWEKMPDLPWMPVGHCSFFDNMGLEIEIPGLVFSSSDDQARDSSSSSNDTRSSNSAEVDNDSPSSDDTSDDSDNQEAAENNQEAAENEWQEFIQRLNRVEYRVVSR